jgi:hypothetical protein
MDVPTFLQGYRDAVTVRRIYARSAAVRSDNTLRREVKS